MPDSTSDRSSTRAFIFAHLLLRLWISLRLFLAGLDKFRAGSGESVSFNMENYKKKSDLIANLMSSNSFLPKWMCDIYAHSVGFALVAIGLWVVLGIVTEFSLLAAGLLFLSLGFGLAALPDDQEVVNIGLSIAVVAGALLTSRWKQISLDGLLSRRK